MSNFSPLLMQDITQAIDIPEKGPSTSADEQQLYNAYLNPPWLSDSTTDPSDVKVTKVDRDLLFQVLMIENITKSKQAQLEDLKEKMDPKNQRVDTLRQSKKGPHKFSMITQVDLDLDNSNSKNIIGNRSSQGETVFKITLQSKKGDIFFAINTTPINWASCFWGAKIIILKGTLFNRGVFYLTDSLTVMKYGSVHPWTIDQAFKMQAYLEGKLSRDSDDSGSNPRKRKATDLD